MKPKLCDLAHSRMLLSVNVGKRYSPEIIAAPVESQDGRLWDSGVRIWHRKSSGHIVKPVWRQARACDTKLGHTWNQLLGDELCFVRSTQFLRIFFFINNV